MSHSIRRLWLAFVLIVISPAWAAAQATSFSGTIDAEGETVTGENTQRFGVGTVAIGGTVDQTLSFYVSADGSTFFARKCTPTGTGSGAVSTTTTGGWECPVSGWRYLRVVGSAYGSGAASIRITYGTGGGAGGGGSSGGGGETDITAVGGNPVTTTLPVDCVSGCDATSATLADDADFTDGTTEGMPIGGVAESASPTTVTEGDFGWAAITLNRALKTSLFNASGTAAFGAAGTAATPVLTVQGIPSMTPIQIGDNSSSITVDNGGTFATQAAQSGTWNITNVSGTVSLPTGASTAANQTTVIGHVDGIETLIGTSNTSLALIDNLPNTLGSTTSGQSGALVLGAVTTSAPSYTTAQSNALSLTTAGILRVGLFSASGTEYTPSQDWTVSSAIGTTAPGLLLEGKDFDGSALPATASGAEGDGIPFSGSLSGVAYSMIVSEDGALSAFLSHDAIDSGFLVGLGARAIAHGTNPTAVAAADRSTLYTNRAGVLWTIAGHPNLITREATWTDSDGAQTNTTLVDVSAGTKIVVTSAIATCDAANGNATAVRLGFGASLPAASTTGTNGIVLTHGGIAPGSGVGDGEGAAVIGIGGDGEDLKYTAEDPTSGDCRLVVKYFTIES